MNPRPRRIPCRRRFLGQLAAVGAVAGTSSFRALAAAFAPSVSAAQADRFAALAELLRTTPRDKVFDVAIEQVAAGASYRDLLGGVFLAGIHDIEPRPVGFKLHTVMMVPSALELTRESSLTDWFLPALFNLDDLKEAQEDDREGGDWVLPPRPPRRFASAAAARSALLAAVEEGDTATADAAVADAAGFLDMQELFELLWPLGARDYLNIGHRMIFTSQAYRALQIVGWQHGEPAVRSLVYGLLERKTDATMAPYGRSLAMTRDLSPEWEAGKRDSDASQELLRRLRPATPATAQAAVLELLGRGIAPGSLWDGLRLAASELLLKSPGLLAVHAMTTLNAFHFATITTRVQATRALLLLQAAAWMPMFRDELKRRVGAADGPEIDSLEPETVAPREDLFSEPSPERRTRMILGATSSTDGAAAFVERARALVLRKGDGSHHYKYSAAAFEEHRVADSRWAPHVLAASLVYLPTERDRDAPVYRRARKALEQLET